MEYETERLEFKEIAIEDIVKEVITSVTRANSPNDKKC